jgi:hypothetical protein
MRLMAKEPDWRVRLRRRLIAHQQCVYQTTVKAREKTGHPAAVGKDKHVGHHLRLTAAVRKRQYPD